MKKSFINIKNFVDSNVRQYRIDRTSSSNTSIESTLGKDLQIVERQFDHLRQVCIEAEKRISATLPSAPQASSLTAYYQNAQANLSSLTQTNPSVSIDPSSGFVETLSACSTSQHLDNVSICNQLDFNDVSTAKRSKKSPNDGLQKFLSKYSDRLKPDSLMCATLAHFTTLQTQINNLNFQYECLVKQSCLNPLQHIIDVDVQNVTKLKRAFTKLHAELNHFKSRYKSACQKQQQSIKQTQSSNLNITFGPQHPQNPNKIEIMKKELDDLVNRYEQSKDAYCTELYIFVCHEPEFVSILMKFYEIQADFNGKISTLINGSLPGLRGLLNETPRKLAFGTCLKEHLRFSGNQICPIISVAIHFLFNYAMNEEGLFRISGSSMKIKKLKYAINSWYMTSARQDDLMSSSDIGKSASLYAIYKYFSDVLGRRATSSSNSQNNSSTQYDVHSIAGLLKLFLREMPEPLLGTDLYPAWTEAACFPISEDKRLNGLKKVIDMMPSDNFVNLRYLVKFLGLLTSHQASNKMTSTNLAIAMAPSLIWSPICDSNMLDKDKAQSVDNASPVEANLSLNFGMKMSSAGMSASLHTLIIDNLITNADFFFPGEIEFNLKELNEPPLDQLRKANSPSGLSLNSSASFDSASNSSSEIDPCKSIAKIDLNPLSDTQKENHPSSPVSLNGNDIENIDNQHTIDVPKPRARHKVDRPKSRPPPPPPRPGDCSKIDTNHVTDEKQILQNEENN